jgi:DNA-binding LytR/AlgR family response regulator
MLTLVGIAQDGMEASNLLNKYKAHIIFLDIEMPVMSGLELVKSLKEPPQIILITSQQEYAVEAFEYDVTDYLLKPVNSQRFLKSINRAKENIEAAQKANSTSPLEDQTIFIKENSQFSRLDTNKILYVEAYRDYVNIYTTEKKYTVHTTMKNIDQKLDEAHFMRIHRSYIVQLSKIDSIDENIVFVNQKMLPIGSSFRDKLMRKLNVF